MPLLARGSLCLAYAGFWSLVVGLVWGFGGNDAWWEAFAAGSILTLYLAWGLAGIAREPRAMRVRVSLVGLELVLVGFVLLTFLQLIPLPQAVHELFRPGLTRTVKSLVPTEQEILPGDTPLAVELFPRPLSLCPEATRIWLTRIIGLLLVAIVTRCWLVQVISLQALVTVSGVNAVALALFALSQAWSTPGNTVYGIATQGAAFGPFVCRNHFPDFLAFPAGWLAGWLIARLNRSATRGTTVRDLLSRPEILSLALSVVLLSFAVLMSQSRGGVLAWSLAAVGLSIRAKLSGTQLLVVTSVLALAVGVTLGNEKLRGRWLAFLDGGSAESRLSLWVNGSRALGEDFIFGTGQGTFRWVEGRYRTNEDPRLYSEHAHNEYLDALVEGGVLRLGLTVFFLVRVLRLTFRSLPRELSVLARGYLYGTQFGLVVLVLHSAVDFGIHMPAVAVLATVSLIFAEHHLRRSEHVPPESESGLQPYSVVVVPGLLAAFLLFGSAWTREAADAFRRAGIRLPRSAVTQRILLAEQRCRLLPTDSQPLYELAIAHLDAADRRGPECHAAVGGGPMLFLPVEMRYPREIQRQHLEPALRALRTARMLHPMSPEVQAELALFAPFFMKADPPGMYAERALRLLPSDAQMHRIAAVSAWEQQDFARAHKHWQQALTLNRALLPIIVRDLGKRVPQKDWINIVGVNPASLGDLLRMSSFEQKIHDEILERIVQLPAISQDDRLAQARATQKLGRTGEAIERWNQLIQENPRKREYRQEFLLWLEAEELYLEALPHLEWLIGLQPNHRELLDRLKFVQHGAKLQKFLRE